MNWAGNGGYLRTSNSFSISASGTPYEGSQYTLIVTNCVGTNVWGTNDFNSYDGATHQSGAIFLCPALSETTVMYIYRSGLYRFYSMYGPNDTNLVTLSTSPIMNSLVTNNALQTITNIPVVTSDWIPMGAFWSNNIAPAPYTSASAVVITNTGDAFEFSDSVTNTIRFRWHPPWDWNAGTVMAGLRSLSRYTNDTGGNTKVTNSVFSIRMASVPDGGAEDNLTFGTAVWTTNKIHFANTNLIGYTNISTAITVGNTPTSGKSIVIEISRLGAATGDTTTNIVALYGGMTLYYQRNTRLDFPSATP
jgi:hypothetical protein